MTEPTGNTLLLAAVGEVAEAERDEMNRLEDGKLVPCCLSLPGFIAAERYALAPVAPSVECAPPQYLVLYWLTGPEAASTPAFRSQLGAAPPSNRDVAAVQHDNAASSLWTKLRSPWIGHAVLAPAAGPKALLAIIQSEVDPDDDRAAEAELVPRWLSLPGILACERFAGTSKQAARLTLFYVSSPEVMTSPAVREGRPAMRGILWLGTYLQRPSPWTIRAVPSGGD